MHWYYGSRLPRQNRRGLRSPSGIFVPPFAVSPDGRWIVFAAALATKTQLWVRGLDALVARPLPGSEGARYPFWSPDSKWIGFLTPVDLIKVNVAGGAAQKIAPVDNALGGTWNEKSSSEGPR